MSYFGTMELRIDTFKSYQTAYLKSIENPQLFWSDIATTFEWITPHQQTFNGSMEAGNIRWFDGGKLNITINALDRHLESKGNDPAIIWEPNDPDDLNETISYKQLHQRVCAFGSALRSCGIEKGDRVILYMPMTPELAIAVLACARIGAVHSVVFAGFSAQALADRIQDAQAKMVITADESRRGGKTIPLKSVVDTALTSCPSIEKVIVQRVTGSACPMESERDVWMHEFLAASKDSNCPPEIMEAEDPLFILYTSGSTGKPKGVVHTTGGYMVYTAYSFANVFQYEPGDIYWCTADIGWITGHSYIIYGPLLNGATTLMFEGIPTYPDASRFWAVCEKYRVNQFYTAPTAIRSLMASGRKYVEKHDLSALKVLGTVGEPINEEAWHWYNEVVGKSNCPIVDTWWQTETGGIMISGLGNLSPTKPAHAGLPLPGIDPVLLDPEGNEITRPNVEGLLCIRSPWPSMIRTTYGDHERCLSTYFRPFPGYYFTGDGARKDELGMIRVIGRVDDVINVSGHRFGTAEIESAINQSDMAVESAVVGFDHEIKGQGIHAFVITEEPIPLHEQGAARARIIDSVEKEIGKIARPDRIQFVAALPKTRSGKIMRRILRKVANGDFDGFGDTSTLLDPCVVESIVNNAKSLWFATN